MDKRYLLLQINDAAFPIGAYAHSFGLETYIQAGIVHDAASAQDYLEQMLKNVFLYGDLLLARLAWESADRAGRPEALEQVEALEHIETFEQLEALEEHAYISRTPRELREAATKLGSRFFKMIESVDPNLPQREQRSYAITYGEFCALEGIDCASALSAFIFAQTSAQVTTCVKAIPLSQTAGQQMLTGFYPLFGELLTHVGALTSEDLFRSSPGYDIRAMQHEQLYSRLYMS